MKVPEPKKQPSGNWFIQMRLGGESVPVTASTAKKCRDKAMFIKAEHKVGKREIKKNTGNITLRQAVDNYIAARNNTLSPLTIRGYRIIQNNRFQSVMDKSLSNIDNWQKICNAEQCAPKTLLNSWRFICSVLRENGTEPPKITLPQVTKKERPWLEPDDIPEFIKAVKGKPCEIPALLALHGLRRSEIYALTWNDIDFKHRRIKVDGAVVLDENNNIVEKDTNKNASSRRYVPIMIDELYDVLRGSFNSIQDKQSHLMQNHPNTLWSQINRICKANDLPQVGVHGLRHSFASLAYHLRVPEMVAMQIGGWSDYGTMRKIYTHLGKKDMLKYERDFTRFYKNANENANEK